MASTAGKALPPIHPNAGVRAAYRRRLDAQIDAMHRSLVYWLRAAYRANTPELAQDASPAMEMRRQLRKLGRAWQARFDKLAPKMARYFATAVADRVDGALAQHLKDAGFTVALKLTPAQNDALQAVIGENVSLIKSIASQHLTRVEGVVMRSVTEGRDLASMVKELRAAYGVTQRRAAFIATDQINKATAVLHRVRQVDAGFRAKWLHSAGGRTPRPSHVKQSGNTYDPAKGWYDPDAKEWCWPGTLPRCRCVSVTVVPAFE